MPKAGYCKDCQKNVWLKEDGGGECGHPASNISNAYETSEQSLPKRDQKRTYLFLTTIAGIVVLSCAMCCIVGILISTYGPPSLDLSFESPTNQIYTTIQGNTTADAKVLLYKKGKAVKEIEADSKGDFEFKHVKLDEGDNDLKVKSVRRNSKSASKNITIVRDSKTPKPPTITTYKKTTNRSSVSIGGTAERGCTVLAYRDEETVPIARVISTGKFRSELTGLQKGKNKYTFKAVDKAGNVSKPSKPIVVAFVPKPEKQEDKPKPASSETEKEPPAPKTINNHTSKSIKSLVRKKVGAGISEKITDVQITPETGNVYITYENEEIWDENDSVFDTCETAKDIMPVIFKIEGVASVYVELDMTFTDVYGKKNKEKAVLITVGKEAADKINWKEINSANRAGLIRVCETVYIHPGVMKEIDNEDILEALAFRKFNE